MAAPVLQFKRGLLTNLPGLRAGEPGFTTDSYDLYVGIDSTTTNNKFFGSHRYWSKETTSTGSGINLVEGTSNGSQYLTLKAPDSLSGIATYVFPDTTDGSAGDFLKLTSYTGNVYTLEWTAVPSGSFSIAGDTGTDTFTTGETLTFEGGTNLNSAVTNNKVTFNLDDNINVTNLNATGITTLAGNITLGDNTSDDITVGGEFVSSLNPSTTNTYDLGTSSQRWRNGWFSGNINVAGIITAVGYSDLTIANKDIVMAYLDGVTETDTTANHGGIAIASTEGSPLINISVAGINTLPSTYKQIMWVKKDTFTGLKTDTWMSNYGVAIGTTSMANGVRLAVGTGVTVSDTEVSATTFRGSFAGTATTATKATLVDTTTAPNGTFYPGLFVNNTGTASTAVYVDAGISYVSNTDTLTLTGDIAVNGGDVTTSATTFNLVNGTATNVNFAGAATAVVMGAATGITTVRNKLLVAGNLEVDGNNIQSSTGANVITLSTNNATFANDVTVSGNLYINGSTTQVNTSTTTIEDQLLELGMVDGSAPSSDLNKDIGVLLNYYTASAKKAAMFWDDSASRIVFADDVTESTGVLTVASNAYAAIEIESLWVNDCAGQSQVINCSGSTRTLENITIDGGSF